MNNRRNFVFRYLLAGSLLSIVIFSIFRSNLLRNDYVSDSLDDTGKSDITVDYTEIKNETKNNQKEEDTHKVKFSHAPGFYDSEFKLTLSSDGGNIYYTTDGSVPTTDSTRYTKEIRIADATQNANVHSLRTDVSTGFMDTESSGYAVPSFNVDKCTIIRAIAYYEDGSKSDIATATYFVGFQDKTGYENTSVISLMTDPDNLFDYSNGIYVCGKTFDDYRKNRQNGVTKKYDPYWWWWDCNYNQKGDTTEREAVIQFFSSERELELTKNIGIRIQGGGSRGYVPRSFNFYARKKYDGQAEFNCQLFETDYLPKRVTLFAGGDDVLTKFKDWFVSTLCADENFATMDYTRCVLFLDGEYWGNYWLTEKYDEEYLNYHYGVSKDNVVIVKNEDISVGEENDISLYNEMKNYISENVLENYGMRQKLKSFIQGKGLMGNDNYNKVCELIDIDSYVAYYAAQIYIARYNDWPLNNESLWRTRTAENGQYGDCKWRWMLFDVNSGGMELSRVETDSISYVIESNPMFASLWKNSLFRAKIIEKLLYYADTVFSDENVTEKYEIFCSKYAENMHKEFCRFYADPDEKLEEFNASIADVKCFFQQREQVIRELCKKYA